MRFIPGDIVQWQLEPDTQHVVDAHVPSTDTYLITSMPDSDTEIPWTREVRPEDLALWSDTIPGQPLLPGHNWFKEKHGLNKSFAKFSPGEKVSIEGRAAKVIAVDERRNPWADYTSVYYLVEYEGGGRAELPERDLKELRSKGCECGAKYTTFADMHMHYCPLAPQKVEKKDGK